LMKLLVMVFVMTDKTLLNVAMMEMTVV
jgi:hypothetical protein